MTPRGTFIGLNTIDIQFLIEAEIEENSKYKAFKNGTFVGGPATNAAICFSHLGGRPRLFTPIGNHHFSNFIFNDFEKNNVDYLDLADGKELEPIMASIITNGKNGNRTVFSYHPNSIEINANNCKIDNSDVILVDGFYLDITLDLIKKNNFKTIPLVLDGGSWKHNMEKLLPHIDIAICSENFTPPDTKSQEDVFAYLHNMGIDHVAITNGNKPIKYSIKGSGGQIFVDEVNAVDTLGAGDFFHGAFCYYFAIDNDFIGSLLKASKIAGKSCEYFGTREWMERSEK